MERDCNDGEILLQHLGGCCSCNSHELSSLCTVSKKKSSVPEVLSQIKGPWAVIYWQVILNGKFYFVQVIWLFLIGFTVKLLGVFIVPCLQSSCKDDLLIK